ncbi:MAG: amidohydrolase family protein [Ilumatobacteraceae bacterium]
MAESGISLDWLVSVDDHVLEPPNVWQDRIPARYKDMAPKLVQDGAEEYWTYEGKKVPTTGLSAVAGKSKDEFSPEPVTYANMRPGCYDSKARLADMDRAGIIASLCFPSFPRFCGQIFWEAQDKDLALLCVKAYNDWMIEEWCGAATDRFIPLTLIPFWDTDLCVAELERCAAMGSHAFAFSENPEPLGLPTVHDKNGYWDPVMAAANDLEMVVCMHVGSSSTMPKISSDSPFMANLAWGANRTSGAMLTWLFSPYFQRHDNLKIALSEGEIGWIPFFLERAEQVYDKQRHWVEKGVMFGDHAGNSGASLEKLDLRQLYRDHVFGCFIDDVAGLSNLDVIGEDNVMIETDYPHSDSTWPDSIKLAQERLAHLDPAVQYKILRGNAERLFHFQAASGN